MMITKLANWQLVFASFAGGIALSFMELYQMFAKKETADIFFFGGMFIAGIMGIAGYVLASAENVRSAFLAGVSAPQLLGGIVKAGTAGAQTVSLLFFTTAYAAMPSKKVPIKPPDSTYIAIHFNNVDTAELVFKDTTFLITSDNPKIKIRHEDSVLVRAKDASKVIYLTKGMTLIKIETDPVQVQTRKTKLFRGLIAQKVFEREKHNIIITSEQ